MMIVMAQYAHLDTLAKNKVQCGCKKFTTMVNLTVLNVLLKRGNGYEDY